MTYNISQKELKKRFDSGDTKVDLCSCGIYYKNEFYDRVAKDWAIYYECFGCRCITAQDLRRQIDDSEAK